MAAFGSLLFVLSGFTALLYQVVWQRLLALFSGTDVYAATIIVGAFMAGLGVGSLAGGHVADRCTARTSLAMFAAAELGVGLFGLLSAWLYYDILYLELGQIAARTLVTPVVLFVSLLLPTFLMGTSLPLLGRALTHTIERAAPTVGALYGFNALGASLGALLTTWWLMPTTGLEGSLRISGVLNVGVAIGAAVLAFRTPTTEPGEGLAEAADEPTHPPAEAAMSFAAWVALSALSGFLALSLEIAWFRALGVIAKSTAFTFGTLLAVYLGGLGLGALVGSTFAHRVRHPAKTFLLIEAGIGIYVGLSVILLLSSLNLPALDWLLQHLSQYDPLDLRRSMTEGRIELPLLYIGLPIVLIGPPTLLMGISFPLLQRIVQTDLARLGSRVGTLALANIAGSMLGAILTGWLGLRYLGTAGTLRLGVVICGLFGLMGLVMSSRERSRGWTWTLAYAASVLLAGTLVATMPAAERLWAGLHGVASTSIVHVEDETGLSLVKLVGGAFDGRAEVFVNGLGQSWMPYGNIHTVLGALPALMHPHPRHAAVVGLGSGDTAFGLAGRREIERITAIEIVRSQFEMLTRFDRVYGYPGLRRMIQDPRIDHVNADGRLHVMRAGRQFDIVEADALRPGSAYAGNLHSDRFFALLRDSLKPGGLAVIWASTPRTLRTFLKVFPHVVRYRDILIGSRDPIDGDPNAIRTRMASPGVFEYYASGAVDIRALIEAYIGQPPELFDASHDRSTIVDVNTDLFPRDELDVPALSSWRSRPVPTD